MGDVYLSWKAEGGLVDAGKVSAWPAVRRWVNALPDEDSAELRKLVAGKPADAEGLEGELARSFGGMLALSASAVDGDLWQGLAQLLAAVVARRPGETTLVSQAGDGEDYQPRYLFDWVASHKDRWAKWTDAERRRLLLLLKVEALAAAPDAYDVDDDEWPEQRLELAACLSVLADRGDD